MQKQTQPLPLYVSHKVVQAVQIAIILKSVDGSAIFTPEDHEKYDRFEVSKEYMLKHNPQQGGYYVKYEDGYESFSPAGPFENGYTPLQATTQPGNSLSPAAYPIDQSVFPSKENTVYVNPDHDFGGAHSYEFKNCLGFKDGETLYNHDVQKIQFVQKNFDGTMTPGLQTEQILIALIDRTKKLNNKFPCDENEEIITALETALGWSAQRVKNRMERGVMGEHKK